MKRVLVYVIILCFTLTACAKNPSGTEKPQTETEKAAYATRWQLVVGNGDTCWYVAKDKDTGRYAIFDEGKNRIYVANNGFELALFKADEKTLYFMEHNPSLELKYCALNLDDHTVREFCKIPSGGAFIEPIIYGDDVFYQMTDYECNTGNIMVSFPLNKDGQKNVPTLIDKDSWPWVYPADEFAGKEIIWEEHEDMKIIGIVDDAIYYAYDPDYDLHPNKVGEPRYDVVAACDLDGNNKRVIVDSNTVGRDIYFVHIEPIRIDDGYMYVDVVFEQGEDGLESRIYRVDLETKKTDYIASYEQCDFVIGETFLYFIGKDDNIYRSNKNDLTSELFLKKSVTPIYASDEHLYFSKTYKVKGERFWKTKVGRIKVDCTGFEWLE